MDNGHQVNGQYHRVSRTTNNKTTHLTQPIHTTKKQSFHKNCGKFVVKIANLVVRIL